ncbi:hypothetical protein SAMN02194393_00256 [Maledivibacter halophilus]|uniref:Uncharacterized protein n=1 Tax=Maledivibacter halophilus TaxID=36842 RepID=A0A1T5IDX3_9FIRM|nr:hypothetical protein SAMN02194393_00256 [Maledivibacter halophilus]
MFQNKRFTVIFAAIMVFALVLVVCGTKLAENDGNG